MNIPASHTSYTRPARALHLALSLLVLLAGALVSWAPASAAPASAAASARPAACPHRVTLPRWRSEEQLARSGFLVERYGDPASVTFGGDELQLGIAPDPTRSIYTASRITETDPRLPIAERQRCWQPDEHKAVEASYTVRFAQAAPSPELITNLVLWNSPFPFQDETNQSSETPLPVTAFGVSRLAGMYVAAAAQDFDGATGAGLFRLAPMPAWLDPTDWHEVTVLLTTTTVSISVAQGGQEETVLTTPLLRAPDRLGLQLSIDNDGSGVYNPVSVGDQIDVDRLDIRYRRP